jgi:hypothetical protein
LTPELLSTSADRAMKLPVVALVLVFSSCAAQRPMPVPAVKSKASEAELASLVEGVFRARHEDVLTCGGDLKEGYLRVTVQFDEAGTVASVAPSVESTVTHPAVRDCAVAKVRSWVFPVDLRLAGERARFLFDFKPFDPALEKEEIRATVGWYLPQVRGCYERTLRKGIERGGEVAVRFVVGGADGRVRAASVISDTVGDPELVTCVTASVKGWRFNLSRGSGEATVEYPFVFRPTVTTRTVQPTDTAAPSSN